VNTSVLARARLSARGLPRDAAQIAELLRTVLSVAALASLGAFVVAAVFRLGYPYPLQQTEAISLEEVLRILRGQALYVEPTLQHVPLTYGPVSFYLSAGVAAILGPSYLSLRLISLLASLGTLTLVAYLVHHETGSRTASLVGAGLLAATYPVSGEVMDQGRVDALFTFFVFAGLALARTRTGWRALAASGFLVGLAALTKLPVGTAPVALAIVLYLVVTVRTRALAFIAGAVVTVALGLLALRLQSGPWPTWFMLDLPGQHTFNDHGDLAGRFWFIDLLPRFTFALLIGPVFLLGRAVAGDRRPLLFYSLTVASLLGLGWVSRSNSGGAVNVELPAHAGIALFLGLGVDWVLRQRIGTSVQSGVLRAYLLGVCVLQFAILLYNPRLLIPYRSEQWAADRLSTTLASLPGEVLAPDLDAYLMGSQKGEQPHGGAVDELFGGYGGLITQPGLRWRAELDTALAQQRYSYVVVMNDACCGVKGALDRNGYVLLGPLFPPGDDYWLWTNGRTPADLQIFESQAVLSGSR
jgi:4-amino-4-deoxy-L-arabinose transferase-like glycosyltransferase